MAGGNPVAFRDRLDWTIGQRSTKGCSDESGAIQEFKYVGLAVLRPTCRLSCV